MLSPPSARVQALDVLRGAAVGGMLLVTMPGDWAFTYHQLRHADWNGWTAADMVFPAFLFSVGMAFGLGFERMAKDVAARRRARARVARRAASLFALGLGLEVTYNLAIAAGGHFPGWPDLAHLRIMGVLQRIGLCYVLAALVAFATARAVGEGRRLDLGRLAAVGGLALLGYGLALRFWPTPGFGPGRLDPVASLPAVVDRAVLGVDHLWVLAVPRPGAAPSYDPEGLLSTLPASVNVLIGMAAAQVWRSRTPRQAVAALALVGGVLVASGLALGHVLPINKRLWTPSFVLLSGGVSLAVLAGTQALLRFAWARRLTRPLAVLGANAILAFLLATLLSRLSGFDWMVEAGRRETPQAFGDHLMLRLVADPRLASLACAVGMTALIALALEPLHRRGLHLRL